MVYFFLKCLPIGNALVGFRFLLFSFLLGKASIWFSSCVLQLCKCISHNLCIYWNGWNKKKPTEEMSKTARTEQLWQLVIATNWLWWVCWATQPVQATNWLHCYLITARSNHELAALLLLILSNLKFEFFQTTSDGEMTNMNVVDFKKFMKLCIW